MKVKITLDFGDEQREYFIKDANPDGAHGSFEFCHPSRGEVAVYTPISQDDSTVVVDVDFQEPAYAVDNNGDDMIMFQSPELNAWVYLPVVSSDIPVEPGANCRIRLRIEEIIKNTALSTSSV